MRKSLAHQNASRDKGLGLASVAILTSITLLLLLLGPSRWSGSAQAKPPESESASLASGVIDTQKARQGDVSTNAQQICWAEMIDDPLETFDIPNTPRPAYLESTIDPIFGTRLTRITGDPGTDIITVDGAKIGTWGDVVKHHYSKDQPWNADESLIHLPRNANGSPGDLFLDGETYQVRFARSVPGHDNRWYPLDPALKVYVDKNEIGTFNVYTGAKSVIRTFAEYTRLDIGPWEGNLSYDGKMVALYAQRSDGGHDVFAYDLRNNVKYPAKDIGTVSIDWASISASGNYVVIMYGDTDTQVYDLEMGLVSRFTVNHNHYDLGLDLAGEDVAAGISKSSSYDGLVIAHRLKDAALTRLTTGGYAIHTSTRNNLLPGWAYSSFHPTRARYRDEVVAISTDGKEAVRRFGHMHNNQTDYLAEAMPVPSHDGKRVLFSSNWNASSGRPVGAYVFDARVACEAQPSPTPSAAQPSATALPPTQAPSNTPAPATAIATSTAPPTHAPTNTPLAPTQTSLPATATATSAPPPTETPTNTPLPPTEAPSSTPLPTAIPTMTRAPATSTPPPTIAPTNTATAVPTLPATASAPTETPTVTSEPATPTTMPPTPTTTPENSIMTPTPTNEPTATSPAYNQPPVVNAGQDQTITLGDIAQLQGSVVDDGRTASGAIVQAEWAQASGPAPAAIADPNLPYTTASFPQAGPYVLNLTANDGELAASDDVMIVVDASGEGVSTVESRAKARTDDAEERSTGLIYAYNSELDLVYNRGSQTVGIRFSGLNIPRGAKIVRATVQFKATRVSTGACKLSIAAEDTGNALPLLPVRRNISSRPKTLAAVEWLPAPWTKRGEAGPDQQTPDLSPVIQQLVGRDDWARGNAIVLIITGSGTRVGASYDGDRQGAPLLHVEYTVPQG